MVWKQCPICNKKFQTKNNGKKYCSQYCMEDSYIIKNGKNHIPLNKECFICKKMFKTRYSRKKYCSSKCSTIAKTNRKREQPLYNNHNFLSIRFKILNRDNFRCQYCGRNPKEDNCKLVVDHIIPSAKGGSNDESNLTTACFECNAGKVDKLLKIHNENKKLLITS